mgnify:CR=1 FL=1
MRHEIHLLYQTPHTTKKTVTVLKVTNKGSNDRPRVDRNNQWDWDVLIGEFDVDENLEKYWTSYNQEAILGQFYQLMGVSSEYLELEESDFLKCIDC